ncbi:GlxA family transcriptional regulator [Lentzea sp. NPDC004789]
MSTSHRLVVETHGGLELLERADTVVVPGFTSVNRAVCGEVIGALRAAWLSGARLVGLGTGVFVLAEAGVLTGGPAAIAPERADAFARRFPQVAIESGAPHVEWKGVFTASDTAGTVALLRHLIRRDAAGESDGLASLREWIVDNLESPLPLGELAERAQLSQRTLIRRFRAETGLSPGQWILARRVDAAKTLLETTDDTVDQIARSVGFSAASALRDHFKRMTRITPANYREMSRKLGGHLRSADRRSPRHAQQQQ